MYFKAKQIILNKFQCVGLHLKNLLHNTCLELEGFERIKFLFIIKYYYFVENFIPNFLKPST